jgi:hypothetical protein
MNRHVEFLAVGKQKAAGRERQCGNTQQRRDVLRKKYFDYQLMNSHLNRAAQPGK